MLNIGSHIYVPVLVYHGISKSYIDKRTVPKALFEVQMSFLQRAGFRPITSSALLHSLKYGTEVPNRSVVLTFDDGYRDFLVNAWPILAKYCLPSTVFIITDFVGRWDSFNVHSGRAKRLLAWNDIRQLASLGVCIGSHSCTHRHLTSLSIREQESEVICSKEKLEDKLGEKVEFFAYPYSDTNLQLVNLVQRTRYSGAFGSYSNWTDIFKIPRIPIGPSDHLLRFRLKLLQFYPCLRKLLLRTKILRISYDY